MLTTFQFWTILTISLFTALPSKTIPGSAKSPMKVAVIGLVHTHVHWILGREKADDIEIIAIVEPNRQLALQYTKQHGYSMELVYNSMEEMIQHIQPEAVFAFNTIYDHLKVVEFCAPRGIHVMVEKPLAVNLDHANKMAALARKHQIHLLTNYETSWYGSNHLAYQMLQENKIGPITRLSFHTGHPGPIEIGCNPEFLEWLTDPVLNGGGALTDFGCYGSNLATWYLNGAVPSEVTCRTRQTKPDKYPKVEDDATIFLEYADGVVVTIEASWNWSHNRKDMEIYGSHGYIICDDGTNMRILEEEKSGPYSDQADPLEKGFHDPFALFAQVINNKHNLSTYDVSSLENNLIVMQILEAAKLSAETNQTVDFNNFMKSY